MKIIVEQRVQELIMCLFEQGFLDEWITQTSLDDSYFLPVGFGLRNLLPLQIARGEACKIIMKEGLRWPHSPLLNHFVIALRGV